MKRSPGTLLMLLMLFTGSSIAQQLSPFVVSSSGGFYTNGSGMLSFTTGEMTMVETFVAPAGSLTQGFQQPWDFKTAVHDLPGGQFAYTVYPNPSNGQFTLVTESEEEREIHVQIHDILGQLIYQYTFGHVDHLQITPMDLQNTVSGVYMIALTVDDHPTRFVTKIQIIK